MGLSDQVTQMRALQADTKAAIQSTAERVQRAFDALLARLTAAGEPDPDLSSDLAEMQSSIDALNAIAPESPAEPEPSPVEQ